MYRVLKPIYTRTRDTFIDKSGQEAHYCAVEWVSLGLASGMDDARRLCAFPVLELVH